MNDRCRVIAGGALVVTAVVAAGCSSSDTTSSSSSSSTASSSSASGPPSGGPGGRPGGAGGVGQTFTAVDLDTNGASPGGANTAAVVPVVTAFLASLDDDTRGEVEYDFTDNSSRQTWSNSPETTVARKGVKLTDLSAAQQKAALAILAVALSNDGSTQDGDIQKALLMPSLFLLSRTRAYPAVRTTIATAGAVLATAWLTERTGLIEANPLDAVSDVLIDHPFAVAGVLAAAAATSWAVPRLRRTRTSAAV